MSTTAYYAHIMKPNSTKLLNSLLLKLKKHLFGNTQEFARDCFCKKFIGCKLNGEEFKFFDYQKEFLEDQKEFHFYCEGLTIYFYGKFQRPIVFSKFFDRFPDWFKEHFTPFDYQNNSDRNENVSKYEWDKRARFWEADPEFLSINFSNEFYLYDVRLDYKSDERIKKNFEEVYRDFHICKKYFEIITELRDQGELSEIEATIMTKKKMSSEFEDYYNSMEKLSVEDFIKSIKANK